MWNGERLPTTAGFELVPESATDSSAGQQSASSAHVKVSADVALAAPTTAVKAQIALSSAAVEHAVESYFSDIPVMVKIAECESQFRQYDSSGNVLRGRVNYMDRGVMQINQTYHMEKALSLGDDIMTLKGNMAYARYLYDEEGTRPWLSSSACWAGSGTTQVAQK